MRKTQLRSLFVPAMVAKLALLATACSTTGTDGKVKEPTVTSGQLEVRPASETTVLGRTTGVDVTQPVSFAHADSAFQEKRFDEAVSLFKGYTTQKPENAWGHYMLGLSAWKTKDLDQAESEFLRAIELDSTHVKSRYNLARVYLDGGEPEKATEQIESAMKIDSTSPEGFRLLGRAFEGMGQLKEAEDAYREALKLDHQDFWSMNNLGLVFIRQDRPDEAIGVLARAVELKPENPLFQNNLGMALELNGYFTEAGKVYATAIEKDGSYQKAIDNLERVSGRPNKPGMPELKLEELAQNFVTEIESWKVSQN